MDYIIRELLEEEYSLLEIFLYEAIFVPEGMSAPPKTIISQPELQIYITDFGKKKDDIGLVVEVDTKVVGAVWVRIMNDYGYIGEKSISPHERLTNGKFCSIACGARFIFTSANHTLKSLSTYPFPLFFEEWGLDKANVTDSWDNKGDIVIGNDVN